MAFSTVGSFPEWGNWQKMRGDGFLSAGNGKKYVGTISRVWEMAKNTFDTPILYNMSYGR